MTEPDKVQWRDAATGLPCLIVRNNHGALCGYVGVPENHPWHGVDYDNCKMYPVPEDEYDLDAYPRAHGGLTFANGCSHGENAARGICHIPGEGEPDNVWWLGFDCAHSGDYTSMAMASHIRERFPTADIGDEYRNIDYVRRCVADLAQDAAHIAKQNSCASPAPL